MNVQTYESDNIYDQPMLEAAKKLQVDAGFLMKKIQRYNRILMVLDK